MEAGEAFDGAGALDVPAVDGCCFVLPLAGALPLCFWFAPSFRDPLLAYKKPQLVKRLRTAEQRVLDMQQQVAVQVEARIAELEARLAELEPYRTFVEQMRAQMQREERGHFGDLPPSM